MAIQNRRGNYEDFNPDELLAGEIAVVQEGDTASSTGRSIYVCFEPGVVKRLVDYEDIGDEIAEAAGIYIDDLREVVSNAETATTAAESATEDATEAAEAAWAAAGSDVSQKAVTFTTPSSPASLASGDSLATLMGKLQAYINSRSYVGMIIHSTTLDTEALVKAQYGGTTWIQHDGYMLRGASSGVTASEENDLHNVPDGGADTVTLTAAQSGVRSHGHDVHVKRVNLATSSSGNTYVLCHSSNGGTTVAEANSSGYIGYTSKPATNAHENMPPYKNVYIWERTA